MFTVPYEYFPGLVLTAALAEAQTPSKPCPLARLLSKGQRRLETSPVTPKHCSGLGEHHDPGAQSGDSSSGFRRTKSKE